MRRLGFQAKEEAFEATVFLGALPPVDFRAVCLVRAIFEVIRARYCRV
jgi:hypothetical protein